MMHECRDFNQQMHMGLNCPHALHRETEMLSVVGLLFTIDDFFLFLFYLLKGKIIVIFQIHQENS